MPDCFPLYLFFLMLFYCILYAAFKSVLLKLKFRSILFFILYAHLLHKKTETTYIADGNKKSPTLRLI